MKIEVAKLNDLKDLLLLDTHIDEKELRQSISQKRIFIIKNDMELVAWLRYNLFWDNTPFMNMLYVREKHRNKGLGKALVIYWEEDMKKLGYSRLMLSTSSEEYSQHFYIKYGYQVVGGFNQDLEPYELILNKNL